MVKRGYRNPHDPCSLGCETGETGRNDPPSTAAENISAAASAIPRFAVGGRSPGPVAPFPGRRHHSIGERTAAPAVRSWRACRHRSTSVPAKGALAGAGSTGRDEPRDLSTAKEREKQTSQVD